MERQERFNRNAGSLKHCLYSKDAGRVYTLSELAAFGFAGATAHNCGVVTAVRGAEEYASRNGYVGLFVTLTLPGRFHPVRLADGGRLVPNEKYDGATPRDGQQWLLKSWGRVRAELKRQGVQMHGLRFVEPHSDGSPHWHVLLWVKGSWQAAQLEETVRHYWLRDGGDEPGAWRNRVRIGRMCAGGASGYVAKYIAKSIASQAQTEHETLANSEKSTVGMFDRDFCAERKAWASTWGIRQIQSVGVPNTAGWRLLRKGGAA